LFLPLKSNGSAAPAAGLWKPFGSDGCGVGVAATGIPLNTGPEPAVNALAAGGTTELLKAAAATPPNDGLLTEDWPTTLAG